MSSITPNMDLILATPGSTPGPEWAQLLNDALSRIDQHDHTNGNGVQITSSSLNINGNLSFQSFAITTLDYLGLVSRDADIDERGLYSKNGDLFYRDSEGNAIRMTQNGDIAGTTGSIAGLGTPAAAAYASNTFYWTYDSSMYARMRASDFTIYPYDEGTAFTKSITLKAPTGIEALSSISLTLPSILPPTGVEFLSIDSTGEMNHATLAGTANQVTVSQSATAITLSLPATVNTTTFGAGPGAVGTPSHSFSGDPNTGMYSPGADQVALAAGGVQRLLANTTGVVVTGTLTNTAGSVIMSGSGVSITQPVTYSGSGGAATAHKTSVYTGTLAANTATTISIGAIIYGVYGWVERSDPAGAYIPLMSSLDGTNDDGIMVSGATSTSVRLLNASVTDSRTYRVVVIHA